MPQVLAPKGTAGACGSEAGAMGQVTCLCQELSVGTQNFPIYQELGAFPCFIFRLTFSVAMHVDNFLILQMTWSKDGLPTDNECVYYSCFISEFSALSLSGQRRGNPGRQGRLIQVMGLTGVRVLQSSSGCAFWNFPT